MKLTVQNLTLKRGETILLRDLSFSLLPQQSLGILGQNGVGKSTLLLTLAGILPIFAGKVLLDERPLTHYPRKTLARLMGVLFQSFETSFPQTVWSYCLSSRYPHLPFHQRETQRDIDVTEAALRSMSLKHLRDRQVEQLSGGERRRLALAAVLAQAPQIYLLDEPTEHLDVKHKIAVLDHFRTLTHKRNTSNIMILHDMHHARYYCDTVLLLFNDHSFLFGHPEQILTIENISRLYQITHQDTLRFLGYGNGNSSIWQSKY